MPLTLTRADHAHWFGVMGAVWKGRPAVQVSWAAYNDFRFVRGQPNCGGLACFILCILSPSDILGVLE